MGGNGFEDVGREVGIGVGDRLPGLHAPSKKDVKIIPDIQVREIIRADLEVNTLSILSQPTSQQ